MNLLPPPQFDIQLTTPLADDGMPRSEILLSGAPTGKVVKGAVLEAAIRWSDLVLAFLTDDIPQEDTLRIYLFDSSLNLIDSATLGAMYSTGAFSRLELVRPDTVHFCFIGGVTWTLELLPSDSFSIPYISDPKGVCRPFKLMRRFKLHGKPMPDSKR